MNKQNKQTQKRLINTFKLVFAQHTPNKTATVTQSY
jgi:hypothetical protein